MIRILKAIANYVFTQKEYLSKKERIGFKQNEVEVVLGKIDEEISNVYNQKKKELKIKLELKVLNDVLLDYPNTYNEEELKIIIDNIEKDKVVN